MILSKECLGLNNETIIQTEKDFQKVLTKWEKLIGISLLDSEQQVLYLKLITIHNPFFPQFLHSS